MTKESMLSVAWNTTVQYMRGSSIAGLSHAANSRSVARAVYWLVIFAFGLGFTIQSLHALVRDFLGHPVVISSYLTTKHNIPYPAVTICNMNR